MNAKQIITNFIKSHQIITVLFIISVLGVSYALLKDTPKPDRITLQQLGYCDPKMQLDDYSDCIARRNGISEKAIQQRRREDEMMRQFSNPFGTNNY